MIGASHVELTPWPAVAYLWMWGSYGLGAALGFVVGLPIGVPVALGYAVAVLAIGGVTMLTLGGLSVWVQPRAIRVGLGATWPFGQTIPLTDVAEVEAVHYAPADFGGWGIKGDARRRMWSARGDQALVLRLRDGHEVWIGSDDPERLRDRVEAARGALG